VTLAATLAWSSNAVATLVVLFYCNSYNPGISLAILFLPSRQKKIVHIFNPVGKKEQLGICLD